MTVTLANFDEPATSSSIAGRVAIVTGASGGIGGATARLLARAGAQVVCADANPAVTSIDVDGCVGEVLDVTSQEAVMSIVDRTVERYGRLDIMVNNAGIITTATVAELSEPDLDQIIAINVKGVFFGCKFAAAVMAKQGSGVVINLSSEAIYNAVPNIVAYSMTKAAVGQLTRCLATEVGPSNVRVNAVAPGFIESPMTSRHFTSNDGVVDEDRRKEVISNFIGDNALDHIGQPIDIAQTILFLASDASRYVTGQIFRVNGGASMPW